MCPLSRICVYQNNFTTLIYDNSEFYTTIPTPITFFLSEINPFYIYVHRVTSGPKQGLTIKKCPKDKVHIFTSGTLWQYYKS